MSYDKAEFDAWAKRSGMSPMTLLRCRDQGKREAVTELKAEGYRVVRLENIPEYVDNDPVSTDRWRVVDEL